MSFKLKIFILMFVMAGALLCMSAPAFAQRSATPQAENQTNISEAELSAFVKAYVDNQKIRQEYEPPLRDNTDPQKGQQLQDWANAELKRSLAKQNLTVENYNRIYNRINSDEQLRKKALKLIEEERKTK
jgi:hypothetical protein